MAHKRENGEGSWGTKTIKGIKYYRFSKIFYGKRKDFYGKTKAEVNKKVKEYASLLNTSTSDSSIQLKSFYGYCHDWLYYQKKDTIAPKTFDSYDMVLNQILKPSEIGNIQIKQINKMSTHEVAGLITILVNKTIKNCCKTYINTLYTILSQVCRYGLRAGDFNKNFMQLVEHPNLTKVKPQKEKAVLNIEQVNKLWNEMLRKNTIKDHVQGKVGEYVYGLPSLLVLFLCYTGMRSGEATALKWQNVNLEERYIEIDEQVVTVKNREENRDNINDKHYITITTKTKNKKKRIIPLADRALEILLMVKNRYPKEKNTDNDLVFSKTGKPITNSNLNRTLKNMLRRAGLPENVSVHTLRHSFASILLNEDEQNLYAVSDLLGHSSTDVTYKVYIDIFMKNKAKTLSIFNNLSNKEISP